MLWLLRNVKSFSLKRIREPFRLGKGRRGRSLKDMGMSDLLRKNQQLRMAPMKANEPERGYGDAINL
jgi:hypothetical protein